MSWGDFPMFFFGASNNGRCFPFEVGQAIGCLWVDLENLETRLFAERPLHLVAEAPKAGRDVFLRIVLVVGYIPEI